MHTIKKGVVGTAGVCLALCFIFIFFALPTFAETLAEPLSITNRAAQNAMSIIQQGDAGDGRASGGAVLVNNSGNDNTGLTLYSNAGASVLQPLMRMEIDNPAWDEEVLYIQSDSPTSRGLIRLDSPAPEIEFVETDQDGATGKFEIRVQHDAFQINSRRSDDTTFENKISMTHEGDLELQSGVLRVKGNGQSEFSGGINVTGGCIAIDGKCVVTSAGDSIDSRKDAPAPSASSARMPITNGKPDARSCNSYDERGAMMLDAKDNRLYICNGPERGWDYSNLSD